MSRARMVALTFFMFELSNLNDFHFSDIYFMLHMVPLIIR